jgi:hypothetical protein
MAKKQVTETENPDLAAATPAQPEATSPRVVEWDPNAPTRPSARARAQAAAVANPFRAHIPDELYQAHEVLLAQLGGPSNLVQAQGLSLRRHKPGLENIEAIYIGKKRTNNRPTGKLCVKVHVRMKTGDLTPVAPDAQIPPTIKVGNTEVPTDVESVGDIIAYSGYQSYEKPAIGGDSIGLLLSNGVTGTFGALVVLDDGNLAILSNNHVLADVSNAPLKSTKVLQPGLADADNQDPQNTYVIGTLIRFVQLNFTGPGGGGQASTVDAAAAWTSKQVASPGYHNFTLDPNWTTPDLNMPVKKEGRTTGYTEGLITGVHGYVPVKYQRSDGTVLYAYFTEQLVIEGNNVLFSDEGDSGSLIVHLNSNQPVGLLYAGGVDQQTGRSATYAHPIADVIDQLGIDHFVT